jgi:hypothetical protein
MSKLRVRNDGDGDAVADALERVKTFYKPTVQPITPAPFWARLQSVGFAVVDEQGTTIETQEAGAFGSEWASRILNAAFYKGWLTRNNDTGQYFVKP